MRKFLIFLIILVVSLLLQALDPDKKLHHYVHNHLNTANRLPHNHIYAITQTSDGYIWIGTGLGVVKFDGVKVTVFNKSNTPELKSNRITALFEDSSGKLWIGSVKGVASIYNGVFSRFDNNHLKNSLIHTIFQDSRKRIWFGTASGLTLLQDGKFSSFTVEDGLVNNSVNAIVEDKKENIWIATDSGINIIEKGARTVKDGDIFLNGELITSLYKDGEAVVWIGTWNGVVKYENGEFTKLFQSGSKISILALNIDRDGNLRIGTEDQGLQILKNRELERDGLNGETVRAIFEDREGSLWVGTEGDGLHQFSESKFVTYTREDGLSDNLVWSIAEDRASNIWIGTDKGGLTLYKNGEFSVLDADEKVVAETVVTLAMNYDEKGKPDVWLGTMGGGIVVLRDGKFLPHEVLPGKNGSFITSIYHFGDDQRLIGTWASGLVLQDKGESRVFKESDGLPGNQVRFILSDGKDTVWVGGDKGVVLFKDGKFVKYSGLQDETSPEATLALHKDRDRNIWIGTDGGGLKLLRGNVFKAVTVENGLPDNTIYAIVEDDAGYFWFSSSQGIFKIRRGELLRFFDGEIKEINPVLYGTKDGLKERECTGGLQPSALKASDGKLWFSTIKGVAVVDPSNLVYNRVKPQIHIEKVLADGKELIKSGETFFIEPEVKKIEVRYTAPSFISPEKVEFKYKLENFDTSWSDSVNNRNVYYTNLAPGKYVFKVKAGNSDGSWNEKGVQIYFVKQPLYYQTVWFRVILVLFLIIFLFLFYKIRVRQLKNREKELEKTVEEKTKDLKKANITLGEQKKEVLQTLDELRMTKDKLVESEKIASLAHLVAGIAHEINTPVGIGVSLSSNIRKRTKVLADLYMKNRMRMEDFEEYLNNMNESGGLILRNLERAGELIGSFKQVSVDEISDQKRLFKLKNYISDVILSLGHRFKNRSVEIDLKCDEELEIDSFPGIYAQILTNLILNSEIHGFRGGEGGNIKINVEKKSGHIIFVYRDNGAGMVPDVLKRVFDPFFTSDLSSGSGLGMYIVYNLVTSKLGGTIECESEEGRGVTFYMDIPILGGESD